MKVETVNIYLAPLAVILCCMFCYYLRQVNEVNGGDNAFVRCVCVCRFVCVCARSGRSWELNANSSKTVKATDFKFDTRVPRDSPDMTPANFPQNVASLKIYLAELCTLTSAF